MPLPPGAKPVKTLIPVDPDAVARILTRLFTAYNTDPVTLESMFANGLRDRARLLDTMSERLPRDAKLTLLGIQSSQTVSQMHRENPDTGLKTRVSLVSVIVRSQLEFNDPIQGFQRLEGTNEFRLTVEEPSEIQ